MPSGVISAITANSSPPIRATVSSLRIATRSRCAIAISTRSPPYGRAVVDLLEAVDVEHRDEDAARRGVLARKKALASRSSSSRRLTAPVNGSWDRGIAEVGDDAGELHDRGDLLSQVLEPGELLVADACAASTSQAQSVPMTVSSAIRQRHRHVGRPARRHRTNGDGGEACVTRRVLADDVVLVVDDEVAHRVLARVPAERRAERGDAVLVRVVDHVDRGSRGAGDEAGEPCQRRQRRVAVALEQLQPGERCLPPCGLRLVMHMSCIGRNGAELDIF